MGPPSAAEEDLVATTLADRSLAPSALRARRHSLAWTALAAAAVALVVLPRLPGTAGIRATAVEVAFVALVAESLPFLLAGALVARALQGRVGRRLMIAAARHPRLAVALAPFTGAALPICDCGLVPLARELNAAGVPGGAVNGFVAGAPLFNPIVVLSTLVAFQGRMGMVAGRVVVGLAVAMLVAALAPAPARARRTPTSAGDGHRHDHATSVAGDRRRRGSFLAEAVGTELSRTGPTLVLGALAAATVKGLVPAGAFTALTSQPLVGAAALMVVAFLVSICSQADAFVAASLPVGNLPRLAFMVLGPMLDLRLAALYRREFGGRWLAGYAAVVVPAVLALATLWAVWGPR